MNLTLIKIRMGLRSIQHFTQKLIYIDRPKLDWLFF